MPHFWLYEMSKGRKDEIVWGKALEEDMSAYTRRQSLQSLSVGQHTNNAIRHEYNLHTTA